MNKKLKTALRAAIKNAMFAELKSYSSNFDKSDYHDIVISTTPNANNSFTVWFTDGEDRITDFVTIREVILYLRFNSKSKYSDALIAELKNMVDDNRAAK